MSLGYTLALDWNTFYLASYTILPQLRSDSVTSLLERGNGSLFLHYIQTPVRDTSWRLDSYTNPAVG